LPAVLGIGCPVVFHTHNHVRVRYGRKILEWTLRASDATVIAASQYVAEGYTQKARVVYNGTGDLQRGMRSFRRQRVRVGIIGRIEFQKGQLDFIRAARRIAENGGDAEFFVYGSRLYADAGYEARVRAMAGDAPVIFCGWTDDVARALHDLEILAVPSGPDEAATRVIMEAFSAGTPVVAYRSGGIPELMENGWTGILTETPDFESLARGIQKLMDDRELMRRLSAAGRREWLRRFRVERFRTTVCDLIETCMRSATSTLRE
jgi:glycosyltransferase involved in cell wall biosynthesis